MVKYLLLLHGYTQNCVIFQKKIKKIIKDGFIIILPLAPLKLKSGLGWWYLESSDIFTKPHKYNDINLAINIVKKSLLDIVSDDELYVISFSQGAVLAEIMFIHNFYPIQPKKIILFSPSGIMDDELKTRNLIEAKNNTILVVIGDLEEKQFGLTEKIYSKVSCIKNYDFISHKYGHVVPGKKIYVNKIIKWLYQ